MATNHFLNAKRVEAFIIRLIAMKQTQYKFKLGLFPPGHNHENPVELFDVSELDSDLLDTLLKEITAVLSSQVTRHIVKHYNISAMIDQSQRELKSEQSRNQYVQKTIFEVGEMAKNYLDSIPYPDTSANPNE